MCSGKPKWSYLWTYSDRDGIEDLVTDFQSGYLTRRGFLAKAAAFGLTAATAASRRSTRDHRYGRRPRDSQPK